MAGTNQKEIVNILIDIGHPGHVHLLRNTASELAHRGHSVFYSVREIPIAKRLMEHYGMTPYISLGSKKKSIVGKAATVVRQDATLLKTVHRLHIDIGLSCGIVLSHVSQLSKMKSIVFDDDDDAVEPLMVRYGHPLCHAVITPDCINRKTSHAVYYSGTHELAYLHPSRFTPDKRVLERAGLNENERFFIMRFVALNGHHDVGQTGLSIDQKRQLIELLKPHGRVLITSETPLDDEFEPYRLPVPPEKIHSLMAFSSLFLGDSQTMTSEAAVLGVPAFKCNTFAGHLSVPNMLENKYELCHAYSPNNFNAMVADIKKLLERDAPALKSEWQERRGRLLHDMIDPTDFFVNFIEKL